MPIHIKIKETAELYNVLRGNRHKNFQIDHDKPPRQWLHPTDRITPTDTDNTQEDETPINIYTDGSKSEQGVGAGIVIKRPGTLTVKLMYRMDTRCTNNQADAFAILKALDDVQTEQENKEDKIVTVYTDSRMTLDSLNNTDKHMFLTEEIRQKVQVMVIRGWIIQFSWIKAHAGTSGNELADKLAKETSGKTEIPVSYNRIPKSAIKRDLEESSRKNWQREWGDNK